MSQHPDRTPTPPPTVSRRAALGGTVLAALSTRPAPAAARAQATPDTGREEPNTFRLAGGDGIEITYASTSMTGQPTLSWRGPAANVEYTGDEIQEDTAPFGRLVTVLIDWVADGYTEELTLVLPEVNLPEGDTTVAFSTLAIVTRHLTTIAGSGAIEGAIQRYEVIPLEGTAEILWY